MVSKIDQDAYGGSPALEVRAKGVINVEGRSFKDLNGNGKLDAYED